MSGFTNPQAMWDKRFSTPEYVFGEEPNAFLAEQAARLGQGRALALADGEGRNSVWLAQQGFTVDAFDFSAPAVAKARALAEKRGVSVNYQCVGWQAFDWQPAHYDLIVGIFFQFAAPHERDILFEKIKQSLKPGGVLVIQGYGKNQLKFNTGGPGKIDHLYDEELLCQAFAGFDIQLCNTYETTIHEGSGHSGMSSLVGFVAHQSVTTPLGHIMTKNVGGIDRILRIVAGLALTALAATGTIGLWGWLGLVILGTGLVGYCLPYQLLGFSTCALKPDRKPSNH